MSNKRIPPVGVFIALVLFALAVLLATSVWGQEEDSVIIIFESSGGGAGSSGITADPPLLGDGTTDDPLRIADVFAPLVHSHSTYIYTSDPITGDGTTEVPLGIAYDGTTIGLNASNQLEAISTATAGGPPEACSNLPTLSGFLTWTEDTTADGLIFCASTPLPARTWHAHKDKCKAIGARMCDLSEYTAIGSGNLGCFINAMYINGGSGKPCKCSTDECTTHWATGTFMTLAPVRCCIEKK